MKVKEALAVVTEAIKTDPAYRATWVANLSMTFYDQINDAQEINPEWIDDVCNRAAENFLSLLCAGE